MRTFFTGRGNSAPNGRSSHQTCFLGLAASATLVLMPYSDAVAQDLARGRALFENQCRPCHQDLSDKGMKRNVTDLNDLRKRISGWSYHMGGGWGAGEIDDVLHFLNETVYHFKEGGR